MEDNKIEKIRDKAIDWWGRHNVTTRFVVITLTILLAGTVICGWLGKDNNINHYVDILKVLSETITWIVVIIVAGVNGAPAILEKIIEWKKGF